jgi:predicted nucleotidyltransferase
MIFNKDFADFIKILNGKNVKYVLVGGLAVLMHGHFRTTKDMDIYYEGSKENGKKLLECLDEFGFGFLKLSLDDILDKDGYIKLGREPVRIDLFCDLPGVEFDEVYRDAITIEDEDLKIKVIHVNHLITNKLKAGRLQDLDDVKKLTKIIEKKKK